MTAGDSDDDSNETDSQSQPGAADGTRYQRALCERSPRSARLLNGRGEPTTAREEFERDVEAASAAAASDAAGE
jgi:hypothetical protein